MYIFSVIDIVLSVVLYLIIGIWICYKRNWYKGHNHYLDLADTPSEVVCFIAIVLMPINLIFAFIREFMIKEWDN